MGIRAWWKSHLGRSAALAAVVLLSGIFISALHAGTDPKHRQGGMSSNAERSAQGLQIAETYGIQLNLKGKDRQIVGLGSYLVNGPGDCNGCHTAPQIGPEWSSNPYDYCPPTSKTECPKQLNVAAYLAGGSPFGTLCLTKPSPLEPGSSTLATSGPCGPQAGYPNGLYPFIIYSKNLTPDASGKAAGGLPFRQFVDTIRTGHDVDKAHTAAAFGVDGTVLQVMPWPNTQNMTDDDLFAIYEYLSAVPCNANPSGAQLNSLLGQSCS